MKQYNNKNIIKKWTKLLLDIYNRNNIFQNLHENDNKISENEILYILENQIELLRKRIPRMNNITINNILNFSLLFDFFK